MAASTAIIAELRNAVRGFVEQYNAQWISGD